MNDNSNKFPLLSRISYLMDEQFRFPGTKFRFGLDPILNLIPIAGDMAGLIVSAGLLLAIVKKGASSKLVVLMTLNILLDATIGAIPIVGQIFDFFFKANSRNIELMKAHYLEGKHQGSGKNTVIIVIVVLILVLALLCYGLYKLAAWLWTSI